MTTLPPLAPLPPPEVQRSIPSEEWELYLDAWILLLGARLETSESKFKDSAGKDESAVLFLSSFYHQLASSRGNALQHGAKARTLRKLCFLLTRRTLLEITPPPSDLLEWTYLSELSCCYPSSAALKKLLSDAWLKHEGAITSSLEKGKASIIVQLSSKDTGSVSKAIANVRLLTILASSLPVCGHVLMAGSDFLDTLAEAYSAHKMEDIRKSLVANIYVGLTSLLKGSKPNLSLLLDQLFSLKASAGVGTPKMKKEPTLLSDVICSSDLLTRLERYLTGWPQKRGQDLVTSLRAYQNESRSFHHRYQKPKKRVDKGKGRASDLPAIEEVHAHRMSLITQIQDLFPDLGSGYIVRLLDHYGDNPETIIAHLLDASIPPELQNLGISEQLPPISTTQHDPLPPKSTRPLSHSQPAPIPDRRNIFDNDIDLAELARSNDPSAKTNLRFGRANATQTADDILADKSNHTANKAAILSALATFDSDDDERDDTYDVADVGGTIDSGEQDADARSRADELDLTLLKAFKSNPTIFNRDSATRRSQPRDTLKRETGLTDEALEGWAVMLQRDPARFAKLESKLALLAGGAAGSGGGLAQPEIKPTSYRRSKGDGEDGSGTEGDSSSASRGRGGGRGRGRGRGRGGGGGGRGGGTSGDQGQNTAVSHQRKEQNKASRANHNRRSQRAKKVARAGGLVG
ncbi:ASCC2 family CUE domain-containing protein [Aspergillus stella-maris]|uniref:ASCC2 family CUE domain-containing protein n=1 Tax=Aspergillus stella-maris TaxID=1810926 RepID=UPI003CCD7D1A